MSYYTRTVEDIEWRLEQHRRATHFPVRINYRHRVNDSSLFVDCGVCALYERRLLVARREALKGVLTRDPSQDTNAGWTPRPQAKKAALQRGRDSTVRSGRLSSQSATADAGPSGTQIKKGKTP